MQRETLRQVMTKRGPEQYSTARWGRTRNPGSPKRQEDIINNTYKNMCFRLIS